MRDNTTLRVPLLVPRADGRITFFEIPSHPHPYTSTYSPAHREMEIEGLNRLIIPDRLDPMTPLTPRYPTMMHVFISRLSRLALRSYHQWVALTRLLPHIHVDSPRLLWGLINPNSNIKEYTVHENKMDLDPDLETRDKGEEIEIRSPPPPHGAGGEREREKRERDGAREKGRARRLGFLVSGNSLQSFAFVSGKGTLGICYMGRREANILKEIFMGQEPGRYNPPPLIRIRPRIPRPTSFGLISCAQGNGNGGVSNKLLSEVALDQPARMTLYTTLCEN
ncbi:hypothetical protein YC2023_075065 [Brassica napus]